jgi:hypothetical protein
VLILAFTGSVSLTAFNQNEIEDWYSTNLSQHLGNRPLQYEVSEDITDQVEDRLELGAFDKSCGSSRPKLILTGHSKGGGQAQYAAVKTNSKAVVFNADMVNPVIFSDWMLTPQAPVVEQYVRSRRLAQSVSECRQGLSDRDLRAYIAYFRNGALKDVRMVNDPLTKLLSHLCDDNLPHAPIEWLSNTLTCSSDGNAIDIAGHAIDTVVRELEVCAHPATSPSGSPRHKKHRR